MAYSVLVIDMFHYDPDSEVIVHGFPSIEMATEYARRRTRDSLEELRRAEQTAQELRRQWLTFGEDSCVIGQHYCGASDLDYFIAHPATSEERDWKALETQAAE